MAANGLCKLTNAYNRKYAQWKNECESRQAMLEALQKQCPAVKDLVLSPFAKKIRTALYPKWHITITGPYGLSQYAIWFHKAQKHGGPSEWHDENGNRVEQCLAVTICHGDKSDEASGLCIRVRDCRQNTGKFDKGTVGEINGDVEVPVGANFEWFRQFIEI